MEKLKDKAPKDIRTKNITVLQTRLMARRLKPATVKHAMVLLHMPMRFSLREGLCKTPDASELYFEVSQLDNEKTEMLSAEQLIAFKKPYKKSLTKMQSPSLQVCVKALS